MPPDRVELLPLGSIPKTSSGKLRREETKQLYLAGTLSESKAPAWLQIVRLGAGGAASGTFRAIAKGVKRALEFLYGIYFAVMFSLWIVPTWMIVQLYTDHRAAGRFTNRALKILFFLIGCKVRVTGKDYMDMPGAKIYASNHTSYFDVVALMMGAGSSISICGQDGSDGTAVHRGRLCGRWGICRLTGRMRNRDCIRRRRWKMFCAKANLFLFFRGGNIYARPGSAAISTGSVQSGGGETWSSDHSGVT